MSRALPHQRVPIAEAGGTASNPFYAFLQDVERALQDGTLDVSGLQAQIDAIKAQLAEDDPTIGLLLGQQSIRVIGQLKDGNSFVMLEGDSDAPGPTYAYGTDAAGVKGWHPISAAMLQGTGVVLTVGADGVTTFDLAELTDSGTGTFKLITRDAYGRVSGTADGTTSDVPEGSKLYHTAARVRATVLTGLSTATNAVITAADTVLGALGKLQAQITGLVSDVSGKVSKSGDTMTGALVIDTGAAQLNLSTDGVERGGAQATSDGRNILWSTGGGVQIRPADRVTDTDQVQFSAGGDVLYSAEIFRFLANTADGADTGRIAMCGGGSPSASRGGYVVCFGNESATNPGGVQVVTGNGADMIFSGGTLRASITNTYDFGSATIGWKNVYITGGYYHNGVQVVGARNTGWSSPAGTATKTSFDTATVTTAQLAERVKALTDALIAHGIIGT